MKQLNAAVIGTGFVGPIHIEALRRLGVHVEGVLDVNPQRTKAAAEQLAVPTAYADIDDLLADGRIDCVHIASPNRLHHEHVSKVLAAGKHVVCEKPLAMTSRQTARLVAQAKRAGVVAAVNYHNRFYPLVLEARHRIARGAIGKLFAVTGAYVQDWLLYDTDYNWRVLAEEGGALRAVGDIGTHWLDTVHFLTGLQVEAVFADLMVAHPFRKRPTGEIETFAGRGRRKPARLQRIPITTEDFGTVLLRFAGGARGALTVSQVTAGRKNCMRIEVSGATSALAWNSESPNELWIGHRDRANELLVRDPALLSPEVAGYASYPGGHNEGFPDAFKQLYRAVHEQIAAKRRAKRPLYATFEDAHIHVVLCEAIARSNRTGRWVKLQTAR
jgi:predicted dehydrogenase